MALLAVLSPDLPSAAAQLSLRSARYNKVIWLAPKLWL